MYRVGCRKNAGCRLSFGGVHIVATDFTYDAVTEVLAEALESLSKEAESLGLRVSLIKIKVRVFDDILDATIESISVSGENVKITQTFTYLRSVIYSSAGWKTIDGWVEPRTR